LAEVKEFSMLQVNMYITRHNEPIMARSLNEELNKAQRKANG